jgi:hypothetical protein
MGTIRDCRTNNMELYYIEDYTKPCPYCSKDYEHLSGVERMPTCGNIECLKKRYLNETL